MPIGIDAGLDCAAISNQPRAHFRWKATKRIYHRRPALVPGTNRPSMAALKAEKVSVAPLKHTLVSAAWAWYAFLDAHGQSFLSSRRLTQ
jgi:hypothetical protein